MLAPPGSEIGVWKIALVDKDGSMRRAVCLDQRLVFQRLPGRQAEDCHLATVKIRGGQTEDYRLARMITALKREDYSLRQ